MFTITCPGCQRAEVPMKDCYRIGDHLKCAQCAERDFPTESDRSAAKAVSLADMGTCGFCGKQKPEVTIKDMSGSPVCTACSQNLISRPFPTWVKAFFAGVLLLVGVSMAWNWRFFQAQRTLEELGETVREGDVEATLAGIKRFEDLVPESFGLQAARYYYEGIQALQQDSSEKALRLFEETHAYAPGEFELDYYITQARLGFAFDQGNYHEFLHESRKLGGLIPEDPMRFAYLASAHACLYASTDNALHRDSAEHFLAQAHVDGDSAAVAEYEARIRYRLHSKEIVSSKEYYARFPEGWKP
jgi:hypothetical protein